MKCFFLLTAEYMPNINSNSPSQRGFSDKTEFGNTVEPRGKVRYVFLPPLTLDGWVDGAQSEFIPRGRALGTHHRKWEEEVKRGPTGQGPEMTRGKPKSGFHL